MRTDRKRRTYGQSEADIFVLNHATYATCTQVEGALGSNVSLSYVKANELNEIDRLVFASVRDIKDDFRLTGSMDDKSVGMQALLVRQMGRSMS
jgi:hypothetical protein